jgi:hypothetical protein
MAKRGGPETEVTIAWPILPAGVTVTAKVRLDHVQETTERLLDWARRNEKLWRSVPAPGPDVVPGGSPVVAWSAYDEGDDVLRRRPVGY